MRDLEESTCRKIFEESSLNEEDEQVFLKASHEEDGCVITILSQKQMFKLNAKLIQQHDKIEKFNLDIKDYIEFL